MVMLRELLSIDEVVKELGGREAVAALTGRSVEYAAQNVSNWKGAGGFPPDTFDLISVALEEKGCSAPRSLWRFGLKRNQDAEHANT